MEGKCSRAISVIVPPDNLPKYCSERILPLLFAMATMNWACCTPSLLPWALQPIFSPSLTRLHWSCGLVHGIFFIDKPFPSNYKLMPCLQNSGPSLLRVIFRQNFLLSFKSFTESKSFFFEPSWLNPSLLIWRRIVRLLTCSRTLSKWMRLEVKWPTFLCKVSKVLLKILLSLEVIFSTLPVFFLRFSYRFIALIGIFTCL